MCLLAKVVLDHEAKKMNHINIAKYLLLGFALLFLIHFEGLYLAGIKISHLWRGALLLFLLLAVFRKNFTFFIYKPLIILAFVQLLNYDFVDNPYTAVFNFSSLLLIPVIGMYMLRFRPEQLERGLIFFASFFILSFIPYYFGWLESLGKLPDLTVFGGGLGIVGLFQNPHSASIALAFSLLSVAFFFFEGRHRIYFLSLFFIGVFFLVNTFVRTGLLAFILGFIPLLYFYGTLSMRALIRTFALGMILAFVGFYWVVNSEVVMKRMMDQRTTQQLYHGPTLDTIGSGRLTIYKASYEIYKESNIYEILLGKGSTESVSRMYKKRPIAVVSHNAYLDLLNMNGILGLILFIVYLYNLYKKSSIKSYRDYRILFIALFIAYISVTITQDYSRIVSNILLLYAVSILWVGGRGDDITTQTEVCHDTK